MSEVTVPGAAAGDGPQQVTIIPRSSPAEHRSHAYWMRQDPYYQSQLFDSPMIRWSFRSRDVILRIPDGEGNRIRFVEQLPEPTPLPERSASNKALWTPRMLAAMGALAQWHTMSTRQLAAAGGWKANQGCRVLTPLWDAGILERTRTLSKSMKSGSSDYTWRIRSSGQLRQWLDRLDDKNFLQTTFGKDITVAGPASAHVVHNLLMTEMALRAYERVPNIEVIYGERFGDAHMVLPSSHPKWPPEPTPWRADAVAVRSDGMRLMFELIHSVSSAQWRKKLPRWVEMLGSADRTESGAILVLFNAVLSEQHNAAGDRIRAGLKEAFDEMDPKVAQRARTQIVVASWREWFPMRYEISDRFLRLEAAYWSGKTWRRVALSQPDPTSIDPKFQTSVRYARFGTQRPPWVPDTEAHAAASQAASTNETV